MDPELNRALLNLGAVQLQATDALQEKQDALRQELTERLDKVETEFRRPLAPGSGPSDDRKFLAALGGYIQSGNDSDLKNALEIGSDPDGGYITQPVFSPSWTKKIFDASVMRQVSRVETITTGDAWLEPVDWGEPDATWAGEKQARTPGATPPLGMLNVPVHEVYSLQPITQRLMDSSSLNVGAWCETKITEKFGRSESAACVSGNGVARPKGFLSYDATTDNDATRPYGKLQYFVSGAATTVTADALKDMFWGLRSPHRANAVWVMNSNTANAVDKLRNGTGDYIWRDSMTAGAPPMLLGHPVRFEETMPTVAAGSFPIAFGDFKAGYLIVDKTGVRFLRDPFTDKPNVLIYGYRYVGGGCANTDAIKLMKVAAS